MWSGLQLSRGGVQNSGEQDSGQKKCKPKLNSTTAPSKPFEALPAEMMLLTLRS